MSTKHFLLLKHLNIHNANAMSSPYTIGFPAMTAWLGAVHALERKIRGGNDVFKDVKFLSTAVSCHRLNLQTYKGKGDFVSSIINTGNPLDKDGERSRIIEEPRCHLDVSLLIEYTGADPDNSKEFEKLIATEVLKMKFSGGDVLSVNQVMSFSINEEDEKDLKKAQNKLMPGYVLIDRHDLVAKTMKEEGKDALEALMSYLTITHHAEKDEKENVSWFSGRKSPGWLVPISVGFQGISELGIAKNQRDTTTSHRFAESVVTLGEFKMPHRIKNVDEILWEYHVDLEKNLYLCQTKKSINK